MASPSAISQIPPYPPLITFSPNLWIPDASISEGSPCYLLFPISTKLLLFLFFLFFLALLIDAILIHPSVTRPEYPSAILRWLRIETDRKIRIMIRFEAIAAGADWRCFNVAEEWGRGGGEEGETELN